ncbi:MAG: CotH kinase family protein [bacterium]
MADAGPPPPDASPPPLAPWVTELVASNRGSLRDEDGETPDWIELYNPHPAPVDLGPFALSDAAGGPGWRLPAEVLAPYAFRVVFASGKDRRGGEWHTDFRLEAAGEGLWLLGPGGAVAQEFPAVALDADEALGLPGRELSAGEVRYRSPPVADGWVQPDYDDTGWAVGPPGVGVEPPVAASPLDHQAAHLRAWWRFDEAVEGVVPDEVGDHPGALRAGAHLSADGHEGGALAGDGTGFLAAADPAGFDFAQAFTWSVWFRGADDSGALISRNPAGTAWNQGSKALIVRGGTLQWDSGWVGNPRTGVRVTDDAWHHAAVTYDPAGDRFRIFVDGVARVDQAFNVDAFREDHVHLGGQARTGLFIGQADFTGGLQSLDKYAGLIDDVSIWDVALPPEDVALLAQGAQPGGRRPLAGLVGTTLPPGTPPAQVRVAIPPSDAVALEARLVYYPGAAVWVDGALRFDAPADDRPIPAEPERLGLPADARLVALEGRAPAGAPWVLGATVHGLGPAPARLAAPTPGAFNAPAVAPAVVFSHPEGLFSAPFDLTLAAPTGAIHYTLDGTTPTQASPRFEGPLPIAQSVLVQARVFAPGLAPGPVGSAGFVRLADELAGFETPLPVLVIERFGAGPIARATSESLLLVFEPPDAGPTRLDAATHTSRAAFHVRGQSSANAPKKPYRVELRDAVGDDRALPLLGMPAEADWVLHAPYTDQSLIRNALVYGLGRELATGAPRARHCELFVHEDAGPLGQGSYRGVYLLTEVIEPGPDRVDIPELGPDDLAPPAIEGGYLMKFEAGVAQPPLVPGYRSLELVSPDPPAPAQLAWIGEHLAGFQAALMGPAFADPAAGYAPLLDVDSAVDLMVINELFRDQDAYVRSAWLYLDRGGPLVLGPLWDYNLTAGTGGFFDNTATAGWQYQQPYNAGEHRWFTRLMADPAFAARFAARWRALRGGLLADAALMARVDALAAVVAPAAERNFAVWRTLGQARVNGFVSPDGRTWGAQIDQLKAWLRARAAWLDAALAP